MPFVIRETPPVGAKCLTCTDAASAADSLHSAYARGMRNAVLTMPPGMAPDEFGRILQTALDKTDDALRVTVVASRTPGRYPELDAILSGQDSNLLDELPQTCVFGSANSVPVKPMYVPSCMPGMQKYNTDLYEGFTEPALVCKEEDLSDHAVCGEFPLDDLDSLLGLEEESFQQMLLRLIEEKGMTGAQVYKQANLDKRVFSKMKKDPAYQPSKETAMAFAIALRLDYPQASDLLSRAGYAFSPYSLRDRAVRYFIERGEYNMFVIEEALYEHSLPLLCGA